MWHFISSWVLGGRDVGLSLDLGFLGVVCFLKWSFVGGGVGVVLLLFLRGLFLIKVTFCLLMVFSLFCGGILLIFV